MSNSLAGKSGHRFCRPSGEKDSSLAGKSVERFCRPSGEEDSSLAGKSGHRFCRPSGENPSSLREVGAEADTSLKAMTVHGYLDLIKAITKAERCVDDVIQDELMRLGNREITAIQALALYGFGLVAPSHDAARQDRTAIAGATNHNIGRLIELDYLTRKRSFSDQRHFNLLLTAKGMVLYEALKRLFERHASGICEAGVLTPAELEEVSRSLRRLDIFLGRQIRHLR